jgi:tRNA (guanosine-2'-O-)-methyltransferase
VRRHTPNCAFVAEEQKRLLGLLGHLDARVISAALEPFATEERRERFRTVFAKRVGSVAVLMDAPHDPHNGAAVLRSCDAFGVQHLHVIERSEGFLAARTVARGSEQWVDAHTYKTTAEAVAALERSGHELIATHPNGELTPSDLRGIPRLALVLGNERDGIHAELYAACRRSVRIDMRGFAESLNVSVTAAILLLHAVEGRPGDLSDDERAYLYARSLVLSVPHAAEILAQKIGLSLDGVAATSGEP